MSTFLNLNPNMWILAQKSITFLPNTCLKLKLETRTLQKLNYLCQRLEKVLNGLLCSNQKPSKSTRSLYLIYNFRCVLANFSGIE